MNTEGRWVRSRHKGEARPGDVRQVAKCVGSGKERRGDGKPRRGHSKIDKPHPKASGTLDGPLIGMQ